MGRHTKCPTTSNKVTKETSVPESKRRDDVLERLGFGGMICMDCNARAPSDADSCRKCGGGQFREKKLAFNNA